MKIPLRIVMLFLVPALTGLAVFRVAPVLIALTGGLLSETIRGDTMFVGLKNYEGLIADPGFWNALKVTLIFNAILNPLQILLSFCLAMLVLKPGVGVSAVRTAFVLPMTVASSITATIWNILLNPSIKGTVCAGCL